MSRAAKLTLTGTSLFAIGTIVVVHYTQQAEKAVRPFPSLLFGSKSARIKLMRISGNAPRRGSGHGTAEVKEGTPARFRDAEGAGGGIQESAKRT
jgi:hypothetical protein